MTTRIQLRRGTSTAWTTDNPVLALGEAGIETNTQLWKVGDGTTAWNSLPYMSGGSTPTHIQDGTTTVAIDGPSGNVYIQVDDNPIWTFDTNSTFTAPGTIIAQELDAGDYTNGTPGDAYFHSNVSGTTMGVTAAGGITVSNTGISIGGTGGANIFGVAGAEIKIGGGTGGQVTVSSAINSSNAITTSGNITGNYIFGNGSQLTGISTGSTGNITFDQANISTNIADGAIQLVANGVGNVNVTTDTGTWRFNTNGNLDALDNLTIDSGYNSGYAGLVAVSGVSLRNTMLYNSGNVATQILLNRPDTPSPGDHFAQIALYEDNANAPLTWTFDHSGNLTLPGGINGTGTVAITPNSADGLTWSFTDEGSNVSLLTAPQSDDANIGGIILPGAAGQGFIGWIGANPDYGTQFANTLFIDSSNTVTIGTNFGMGLGNVGWVFDPTGNLTLPAGAVISDTGADGIGLTVANPPVSITLSGADHAPCNGTYTQVVGYQQSGLPTWYKSGDYTSQQYIVYNSGANQWQAVTTDINTNPIYINTGSEYFPLAQWAPGYSGGPYPTGTYTYSNPAWTFGADGNLTLPGAINTNLIVGDSAVGQVVIIANSAVSSDYWEFRTHPSGGSITSALHVPPSDGANISAIHFPGYYGGGYLGWYNTGSWANSLTLISSNTVSITTEAQGGIPGETQWLFDTAGNLTLPALTGAVQSIALTDGGVGYTTANNVPTDSGSYGNGHGMTLNIVADTSNSNAVLSATISNPGQGYANGAVITIAQPSSTGTATVTVETVANGVPSINYANGQPYGGNGGSGNSNTIFNGTSNVSIPTASANVLINIQGNAGTKTWNFDSTGDLTIPDNGTISVNSGNLYLIPDNTGTVVIQTAGVSNVLLNLQSLAANSQNKMQIDTFGNGLGLSGGGTFIGSYLRPGGAMQNGDRLAQFGGRGSFDGTNLQPGAPAGHIDIKADGPWTGNSTPTRIAFWNTQVGSSSPTQTAQLTNNGNLQVFEGNVIVSNGAGYFVGDVDTGDNALQAGLYGYTSLGSNVVAQFSGDVNNYAQINFQNINSGNSASTDYILTANNGDDSTYYLDLGLAGSGHTDPAFFGDSATANDGYLYVVGADQTGPGDGAAGNLILGSTNGVIKMFVGNTAQANVVTTLSTTGMEVNGNITTTGNTGNITGANVISAQTYTNANANVQLITSYSGSTSTVVFDAYDNMYFSFNGDTLGSIGFDATTDFYISPSGNTVVQSLLSVTGNINTSANVTGGNLISGQVVGTGNLHLQPDPSNSSAYLDVYLTNGPDVHIAGNSENVIIGGDSTANVTVNVNGNVTVQGWNGSAHVWNFGNDGSLTAPGSVTATAFDVGSSTVFEDTSLILQGGTSVVVTSPNDTTITASSENFVFDTAGNLTVPTTLNASSVFTSGSGGDITMTGGNITGANVVGANSVVSSSNVTVTSNSKSWVFDTVGNLHLPGSYATISVSSDGYQTTIQNDGTYIEVDGDNGVVNVVCGSSTYSFVGDFNASSSANVLALTLRNGDNATTNSNAQIAFGYANTTQYSQFIHTRHNADTASLNTIELWTSDGSATGTFPANAVLGLTVSNSMVSIGNTITNPGNTLDVGGNVYATGNIVANNFNRVSSGYNVQYPLIQLDNVKAAIDNAGNPTMGAVSGTWSGAFSGQAQLWNGSTYPVTSVGSNVATWTSVANYGFGVTFANPGDQTVVYFNNDTSGNLYKVTWTAGVSGPSTGYGSIQIERLI